jgi:hypothetical protein
MATNKSIHDLWKHFSNNIGNKVNDPFDDLWASVVPLSLDDEFLPEISSMEKEEYEGDSYAFIANLCHETDRLPKESFGFFVPARKRDPDTGEVVSQIIMLAVVSDHNTIEFGCWDLATNKVEIISDDDDESRYQGELPIALASLSLKWSIDHGGCGAVGDLMRKSMNLAREAQELMQQAEALAREAALLSLSEKNK